MWYCYFLAAVIRYITVSSEAVYLLHKYYLFDQIHIISYYKHIQAEVLHSSH